MCCLYSCKYLLVSSLRIVSSVLTLFLSFFLAVGVNLGVNNFGFFVTLYFWVEGRIDTTSIDFLNLSRPSNLPFLKSDVYFKGTLKLDALCAFKIKKFTFFFQPEMQKLVEYSDSESESDKEKHVAPVSNMSTTKTNKRPFSELCNSANDEALCPPAKKSKIEVPNPSSLPKTVETNKATDEKDTTSNGEDNQSDSENEQSDSENQSDSEKEENEKKNTNDTKTNQNNKIKKLRLTSNSSLRYGHKNSDENTVVDFLQSKIENDKIITEQQFIQSQISKQQKQNTGDTEKEMNRENENDEKKPRTYTKTSNEGVETQKHEEIVKAALSSALKDRKSKLTIKEKEKLKRMKGQSSQHGWKPEIFMQLRQQFD
ncbi:hypothetical protein RFI_38420 [Reticulomyxa filosa]|uniref:Uncharacterized protein n=1 Tax=Reticulomyxa filosa TaxID=46433 RepID=X6LD62_RETFI|nr:hypothetical protein RFI_38420 [Reticulomyxa filosa]|eukprot:ETN99066.1 hypothetical protein RFI_38420 [Reticulomyxa filosa]